jgi:hypothetical protein
MNTNMIFFVSKKYLRTKFVATYLPKTLRKLTSSVDIRKIKKLYLKNKFYFLKSYRIEYVFSGRISFYLDSNYNEQDLIVRRKLIFDHETHSSPSGGIYYYDNTTLRARSRYLFIIYSSIFVVTSVSSLSTIISYISNPNFNKRVWSRCFGKFNHFNQLIYNIKTI